MTKAAGSFANMRARLQRLGDAKFISGWVSDLDESEVRVRLNAAVSASLETNFWWRSLAAR